MRCVTEIADLELLANPYRKSRFQRYRGFRCEMLIVFREKSVSLNPLHAVNFIVSCRVMASLKENRRPKRHYLCLCQDSACKQTSSKVIVPHYAEVIHLVLKARLEVLFACWQHLFLLLALEGWQLRDCLVDNLESGLDLFLGNDERRCQTDDVLVSGLGL